MYLLSHFIDKDSETEISISHSLSWITQQVLDRIIFLEAVSYFYVWCITLFLPLEKFYIVIFLSEELRHPEAEYI